VKRRCRAATATEGTTIIYVNRVIYYGVSVYLNELTMSSTC
jgi:hypothetical protein